MSSQPTYPIAAGESATVTRPAAAASTRGRSVLGWFWRWGLYIVAIAGSVLMAFPLLWMISTSFKTNAEANSPTIVWVPANPQVDAYTRIFSDPNFQRAYFNSVFVVVLLWVSGQMLFKGIRG